MNKTNLLATYGEVTLKFSHSKKGYYTYFAGHIEVVVAPDYRTTLYNEETLVSLIEPEDYKSLVVHDLSKDIRLYEGEGQYV